MMTCIKLTWSDGLPVAEIWNGTWTVKRDTVWFKNVDEARACTKPPMDGLLWDCL